MKRKEKINLSINRMRPKKKSNIALGLEHLMNGSPMNPFTNQGGAVFNQMSQACGLPLASMLEHIGKGAKKSKEQQRIENRLGGLQNA